MLKNQINHDIKNKSFDIDSFIENFSDIDMYQKNFFLIFQMNPDATTKEIQKRYQQINIALQLGMDIPNGEMKWNGFPVKEFDQITILDLFEKIKQPEINLFHQLFWFWQIDEKSIFLKKFSDGYHKSIIEYWDQEKRNDNYVAYHNLLIFEHIKLLHKCKISKKHDDEDLEEIYLEWNKLYSDWIELLDHADLWDKINNIIRRIDDVRLKTNYSKKLRRKILTVLFWSQANCYLYSIKKNRYKLAEILLKCLQEQADNLKFGWEIILKILEIQKNRYFSIILQFKSQAFNNPKSSIKTLTSLINESQWFLTRTPNGHLKIENYFETIESELFTCIKVCLEQYEKTTEKWNNIIAFLNKFETYFPNKSELIKQYRDELDSQISNNHHYLTSYHNELSSDLQTVIEDAINKICDLEFEEADNLLVSYFEKNHSRLYRQEVNALYITRGACLNQLANDLFNTENNKINQPIQELVNCRRNYNENEDYYSNIHHACINNEIYYIKRLNNLFCQSCALRIYSYENHHIIADDDYYLVLCENCYSNYQCSSSQKSHSYKQLIKKCGKLLGEAHFMNSSSLLIKKNLDFIQQAARDASITILNPNVIPVEHFPDNNMNQNTKQLQNSESQKQVIIKPSTSSGIKDIKTTNIKIQQNKNNSKRTLILSLIFVVATIILIIMISILSN